MKIVEQKSGPLVLPSRAPDMCFQVIPIATGIVRFWTIQFLSNSFLILKGYFLDWQDICSIKLNVIVGHEKNLFGRA